MNSRTIKKATAGGGNSTLISICNTNVWTAVAGPIAGPDTLMVPGGGGVLPAKLIYFIAKINKGVAELEWATVSELNNSFTVDSAADGENFESILKQPG